MNPEDIEGMGPNELIAHLAALRKEYRMVGRTIGLLEAEVRRRAAEAGATLMSLTDYRVELKATKSYEWDVARFKREAARFFSPADLQNIIETKPPVKAQERIVTNKVLPLAKRLGPSVEKAVLQCVDIIESEPKIEIHEIDEADRPL